MEATMKTYETLIFEERDGVATITLNRPEARNALDLPMRADFNSVVEKLRRGNYQALIITGSGGSFCAGGDLKGLKEARPTAGQSRQRVNAIHPWLYQLVQLEMPVIAAVDGPAFGAGFNIALTADFIMATPRARFCQVFGRMGMVSDMAGFFLLPRIIGLQKAKELMFTARVVEAEEALRMGLLFRIVEQDRLLDEARQLAGRFRHASTAAIGFAKRTLNQSFHLDYHALAELEGFAQGLCIDSDYHKQAIDRFLNKQPLLFNWEDFDQQGQTPKERQ